MSLMLSRLPGAVVPQRRALAVPALALTYVVFAMLLNSVAPVILQSMLSLGVDKAAASTLDACKDVPIAATSLLIASWLPRLGYRRALIISLTVVALVCASLPWLGSFLALRLMFVAVGMGFAVAKVSVYSSIGLLTGGPKPHASLTMLIEGLFMCGVLATGWVFSWFVNPRMPGDPGWLHVYWLLAALAATAAALWACASLDESRAGVAGEGGPRSLLSSVAEVLGLLRHRLIATFLACAFVYVLIEQAVQTWLPTFNNEVLRISVTTSLQLASVYAGGLAIGRLIASVLLRYMRWPTLLVACLLMAAVLLLSLRGAEGIAGARGWTSLAPAAFALPLIGLFLAPVYPTICSAVLSALPPSRHAVMTGLIVLSSALGGSVGSFVTGLAFAATDGRTAFVLTLLPLAVLILVLLLFDRQLRGPRLAAG
jgi:fucose permease